MIDWGEGEYERTAVLLMPAAEVVVAEVAPVAGEHVLDVACGTGNAASLAVAAGARVSGIDLAERLVQVARERVPEAAFEVGDAAALPYEDGAFDAAMSVFGVIFADAREASRELLRVVRPGGRIVFTAWVPDGPIAEVGTIIRSALGAPEEPRTWTPELVPELFATHEVTVREEHVAFTAASVEAYVEEQREHHPMWRSVVGALADVGKLDEVDREIRRTFAQANEDPAAFRTTSRYLLFRVNRR